MIPSEFLSLRILLVDDDTWNLELLCSLLREKGFTNVECLQESARAEELVMRDVPDLLVLDLMMPPPDGFTILRSLRTNLGPEVLLPIVVMTADSSPETRQRVLAEGASDFLNKPYDESEVVLRVVNQLRVRWQHLQLEKKNDSLDRDVKTRQRLNEELSATTARLRTLVENLQSGILLEDEHRRVLQSNTEFHRLFGFLKLESDIMGATTDELLTRAQDFFVEPQEFAERVEALVRQGRLVTGEEIELVDGRTYERDYVPIFLGDKPFGHLWAFRDVSQRKKLDRQLKEARDSAVESALQKARFLANMSHEIRTPINGVFGMLGHLAESNLSPDQAHLLRTAQESAESLLEIVNDILDFSKIEAGKLEVRPAPFSPATVIEESLLVVAGSAQAKGVELVPYLDPDVPRLVLGDALRVRQILTNFLSNAVKFTDEGEVVVRSRVEYRAGEGEAEVGARLLIEVEDSGGGIEEETLAGLFHPFVQGDDSSTRKHGGTGLGLAICRQLATIMGGDVGGRSIPGKGSTFWYSMPLEMAGIEGESYLPPPALPGMRVLVVEDNATARFLLLKQVEAWQVAGAGATGAQDALAQLRFAANADTPYNLVVVDGDLPDGQAAQLVEAIQTDPQLEQLRVVLLTALQGSLSGNWNRDSVVQLLKPVRTSQLLDALSSWNKGAALQEERQTGAATNWATGYQLKILVVDDNPINLEVAVRWLVRWGHEVTSASGGPEAVEKAAAESYDLILMDCQMPGMDGYEATALIRAGEAAQTRVPIVAVTAHALAHDRKKCLAAGMDDYLAKPLRPELLAGILTRWGGRATDAEGGLHGVRALEMYEVPLQAEPLPSSSFDGAMISEMRQTVGQEDFAQLVELFVQQAGVYGQRIRECMKEMDTVALAKAAHTLKGMSLQFGAHKVTAACLQLGTVVGAGTEDAIINAVGVLLEELELAAHELSSWGGRKVVN